jgi:hypothetical protein
MELGVPPPAAIQSSHLHEKVKRAPAAETVLEEE